MRIGDNWVETELGSAVAVDWLRQVAEKYPGLVVLVQSLFFGPKGFPALIDGKREETIDNWLVLTSNGAQVLVDVLIDPDSLIDFVGQWNPCIFDFLLIDPERNVLLGHIHYFESSLTFNACALSFSEMKEGFMDPKEGEKNYVETDFAMLVLEPIETGGFKQSLSDIGLRAANPLKIERLSKVLESSPSAVAFSGKDTVSDIVNLLDSVKPSGVTDSFFRGERIEDLSFIYLIAECPLNLAHFYGIKFGSLILFDSDWKIVLWISKDRFTGEWATYRGFVESPNC